jgi:hypothetical protein
MRRLFIFLLLVFVSAFLYSCSKDGKANNVIPVQQQLIVGRWSLKQEKVVQYVDGVVNTDTTYNASSNNIASTQFNKDGTYSSVSLYSSSVSGSRNLDQTPVTTADSTSGIYSFAGTKFSVSAPLAGLGSGSFAFAESTTANATVAVFSALSNSITVKQLSVNRLNLHTENIYTLTNNKVSHTYKNECDYYYEK